MSAPGIAARNAFGGEPQTFDGTIFFQCVDAVLRTGRRITALAAQPRGDGQLVDPDQKDKGPAKDEQQFFHL